MSAKMRRTWDADSDVAPRPGFGKRGANVGNTLAGKADQANPSAPLHHLYGVVEAIGTTRAFHYILNTLPPVMRFTASTGRRNPEKLELLGK
jgi:hypothetical protein